ncbi:MAG: hypothetical protein L3J67_06425 [Hyphomicrobiaceae bacterium]|nr:hypothetical protein [Hyphomicrobiaceae bacterium]
MNKVDRSFAGRWGLVVLGLALFTLVGSPVLAAEGEHGNPGQFVENIRKGLSGISQYFWSPKVLSVETKTPAKVAVEKKPQRKVAIKEKTSDKSAPEKNVSHMSLGSETATRSRASATPKTIVISKVQIAKLEKHVKKVPEQVLLQTNKEAVNEGIKAASALTKSEPQDKKQKQEKIAAFAVQPITGKTQISSSTTPRAEARKPAVKTATLATKPAKSPEVVASPKAITSPKTISKEASSGTTTKKQVTTAKAHKVLKAPQQAEKSATKSTITTGRPQSVKPKIEKKRSQMAKAKSPRPLAVEKKASTSKRLVDQAQVGGMKASKAVKPDVKKQAQLLSPMKPVQSAPRRTTEQTIKKAQAVKKAQAAKKAPASQKKTSRAVAIAKGKNHHKGTYIWLPNKGSSLFSRYGRSGIPADRLVASGKAERKDGRWVFAPYKAGLLPGTYGLSEQVSKVGDEETWVGHGRTWLYVFDKKRTYGTFAGTEKLSRHKRAETNKAGSLSKKRAALKKSAGTAQKTTTAPSGNRVAGLAAKAKAFKPGSAAQSSAKDKKSGKLASASSTVRQQERMTKEQAGNGKTARNKTVQGRMQKNGNWVKENGRWVYRAKGARAQASITKPANQLTKKRNRRTAQKTLRGDWVYRNNRWTYVTRSKQKRHAVHAGASGRDKNTITLQNRAKSTATGKVAKVLRPLAKRRTLQKDRMRTSPRKNKLSRLYGLGKDDLGRSDRSPAKVTRNQKSWVRRNNRWVYAKSTPAIGHKAHNMNQMKGRQKGRSASPLYGSVRQKGRSSQKNSRRHGPLGLGEKSMDNNPGRKFLFFIPGPTPGTGNWFTAPLEMLRHAKKVRKSEMRLKYQR